MENKKYTFYYKHNGFVGLRLILGALYSKENYYNIFGEPLYIYINGKPYKRIRDNEVDNETIYYGCNPYKKSDSKVINSNIIRI